MKRFFCLINHSIPFGRGLNAVAHIAMGMGHWFPKEKMANIMILFADEKTIREFRDEARKILLTHPNETLYSDFTNTMTIGTTDNCVKTTKETSENQLTYYAAGICTEEKWLESQPFNQLIGRCKILKDYQPQIMSSNENDFAFKKIVELPNYLSLPVQKISLTLDRTRAPSELINAAVISSLCVGRQADLNQLKLLIYTDADDQNHPNISYHSFPILAVRQQNKFNELTKIIEADQSLLKKIVRDNEGNAISVCILGTEDRVNQHTRQKFISLWTAELPTDAFLKTEV